MNDMVGGRYKLLEEITSRGTMRLFHAVDLETGTPVDLKTMRIVKEQDLEAFMRFQQEGVLLTKLRHPNIWRIYSTFLEQQLSCIVMERVDGPPLSAILRSGPMDSTRVKVIARQVASALAYAHERSVIHRNLCPDNIVVTANDRVKLRDMSELGIARLIKGGATTSTTSGLDSAAALYASPEQIEGQTVDHRTDIYSLGAVLYEMVTGRPPFAGKTALAVASRQVQEAPTPPSRLRPDLPMEWDAVILKAMAKNTQDRFQTAGALEEAIAALPISGSAPEPALPSAGNHTPPVPSDATRAATSRCPRCGQQGTGKFCGACGTKLVTVS